jgi:DNA-directed RNA polymerase specialized sigma24 family protein
LLKLALTRLNSSRDCATLLETTAPVADGKRLAKLLAKPAERPTEQTPSRPHIHKLAQRLMADEVHALHEAYRAGASLTELQQQFGLSRGSVQRLLREAEIRRRRKSLTNTEIEVLVKQYEGGLTIREIADEQRLPKTTVQDALAKAMIKMRPAARRRRSSGSPIPAAASWSGSAGAPTHHVYRLVGMAW